MKNTEQNSVRCMLRIQLNKLSHSMSECLYVYVKCILVLRPDSRDGLRLLVAQNSFFSLLSSRSENTIIKGCAGAFSSI